MCFIVEWGEVGGYETTGKGRLDWRVVVVVWKPYEEAIFKALRVGWSFHGSDASGWRIELAAGVGPLG